MDFTAPSDFPIREFFFSEINKTRKLIFANMSDLGKTRKFVFANINWVTVCWSQTHYVGFVVTQLIYISKYRSFGPKIFVHWVLFSNKVLKLREHNYNTLGFTCISLQPILSCTSKCWWTSGLWLSDIIIYKFIKPIS
jgi:hypothetical protein